MPGRLDGRNALLIGAAQGIGAAIARRFVAEGARILIADVDQANGQALADELGASRAIFRRADVASEADMAAAADLAWEAFGGLDILVQNAGIYPSAPIAEMSLAFWTRVLTINLTGTFLAARACLPALRARGGGRMIFTSSITGPKVADPGVSAYAATKAGINGFIRTAALEFAVHNITVNGIEPGNIMTEGLAAGRSAAFIDGMTRSIPLGRLGTAMDIAGAAQFLASDDASFITGTTIVVDGGQILPEGKSDFAPTLERNRL